MTRPNEFDLDLKWSLWIADPEDDAYPQGLIQTLRDLPVGSSVLVRTAPRKEIRFGEVRVKRTDKGYSAIGTFSCEWDDTYDLAASLDIPEDDPDGNGYSDALLDRVEIALLELRDPSLSFAVSGQDLPDLFRRIDAQEDALLTLDTECWSAALGTFTDPVWHQGDPA
jgi:hypothetical protein